MNHNCFAFKKGITAPTCSALKTMVCKDDYCPFYKSRFVQSQAQIESDILQYGIIHGGTIERGKHGKEINSKSTAIQATN